MGGALRGDGRDVDALGRDGAVVHAEVLAAVAAHVLDQRHEGLALGRKRVLDARRDLGIGVALNDALLLERAQAQRERARADPRQRALQLTETAAALGQVADDEDRPLATVDVRGCTDGAVWISHIGNASARLHQLKYCRW